MTENRITKKTLAGARARRDALDLHALFDVQVAGPDATVPVDLSMDGLGIASDTQIATAAGLVPAQSLTVGDRVVTRDNGMQRLRWVGLRCVTTQTDDDDRAVQVSAGALGKDVPIRDLVLSPRHRVLVTGARPQLSFDVAEVFVQAGHLPQARPVAGQNTHLQLMFDRHEVVLANGVWCESFHPSDAAIWSLTAPQRAEVFELFPDLAARGEAAFPPARRVLGRQEVFILRP